MLSPSMRSEGSALPSAGSATAASAFYDIKGIATCEIVHNTLLFFSPVDKFSKMLGIGAILTERAMPRDEASRVRRIRRRRCSSVNGVRVRGADSFSLRKKAPA